MSFKDLKHRIDQPLYIIFMTLFPFSCKQMDAKPENDWQVQGSDEEKYDPGKKGNGAWCPLAEDIIKVYLTFV